MITTDINLKARQVRPNRLRIWLKLTWQRSQENWRIFARNRLALLGCALLLIYVLMAVTQPILLETVWPKGIYNPQTGFDPRVFPNPSPPTEGHLLGTDTLGRDVLSMLMAATRPTIILAFTAALTTALISTLVGAYSAFFGGWVDLGLSLISDLALLAPAPIVMVVIGGVIDISPVDFGLVYGLIAGLGGTAIILRAQALSLMSKPFLEASRVAGASSTHIIFTHLVPNMLPLAAVQMLLSVTGAVFADGFSTFLGLSRTRLNWGGMIYSSFSNQAISATIPWNVLIPSALAISLFAASFYFIARGVHEVVEPRLRER
jgi:peptide/nickel transport system permease protein